MTYWRNLGAMATRFLNALTGGDRRGESTSAAVGRKAAEGRLAFVVAEAAIDLLFACFGQRHHCEAQRVKEHG